MAKTGDKLSLGTAEGAVMGRAAHAIHADSPVLDDTWAIFLLDRETQARVRDPASARGVIEWQEFDVAPLFALNVGSLRYAEDEVERCERDGIDQYLILGAGFDTFALRREDLRDHLQVYEVDHPDVQKLKRERIAQADAIPAALPSFVAVDFETTSLTDGLRASDFDSQRRCVVSWMNTIHYLSESATESTLRELSSLCAPASRLALNYACDVPLCDEQIAYFQILFGMVSNSGEPMQSRWKPDDFETLLQDTGFTVIEHATEQDLAERYFEGRADGLEPSLPARLIVAERRP